jgi:DNA-binding LacI/PurR family transcriptional regulator
MRVADRTADRIRRIADEMNYWPNLVAQQLRGRECGLIGVLIGASSTTANFRRLAAIEQEAYRRDQRLLIGQFHGDPRSTAHYLADFLSRGIDRLICFHNPAPNARDEATQLLGKFRSAVFQTASPVASGQVVDVDRAAGVADAVGHLVRTGRERIALVINDSPDVDPLMHDRLRGYRAGLKQAGRREMLEWIGTGTFPPPRALADEAVAYLLERRADAVIASNDIWAIELMRSLRRVGKCVPADIAVVGFDNIDAAALADPSLTTVDQNYAGFAAAVMDAVNASASTAQTPRIVQPTLVIRESA